MTSKAHKARVGLFAVLAGGLLAIVVIVFGGLRFWEGHDAYIVKFQGSVLGLTRGAQVSLDGIRVGTVDDISIAGDLGGVAVRIAVAEGTPVRADTRAMLQYAGITGLRVIDLRGGTLASPALPVGSVIPAGEGTLDKLEARAEELTNESTRLLRAANRVVDNLAAITDPKQFTAMSEIVGHANAAAANLAETSAAMKSLVTDNATALHATIDAVGDSARTARVMLDTQLGSLLTNANDLVLDMRGLVRDNGPTVRSAVFDLRQASRTFKDLAHDVRMRPSRLFFGDAERDRKLP